MSKLLPCPFCGKVPMIKKYQTNYTGVRHQVIHDCKVLRDRLSTVLYSTKEEATQTWNCRAEPENKPLNFDELIAEARELHSGWLAYEIMRHGGGQGAKSDDGEAERKFMAWLVDDLPALCDALEETQNAQRWIPVGERLPEDYQNVLIFTDTFEYHSATLFNGDFCDEYCQYEKEQVTHWMPLPEPPREVAG
mgnify:FL=1